MSLLGTAILVFAGLCVWQFQGMMRFAVRHNITNISDTSSLKSLKSDEVATASTNAIRTSGVKKETTAGTVDAAKQSTNISDTSSLKSEVEGDVDAESSLSSPSSDKREGETAKQARDGKVARPDTTQPEPNTEPPAVSQRSPNPPLASTNVTAKSKRIPRLPANASPTSAPTKYSTGVNLAKTVKKNQSNIEIALNETAVNGMLLVDLGNSSTSSENIGGNATDLSKVRRKKVKFVPFPHKYIGVGDQDAACKWSTHPTIKERDSLLGMYTVPDAIQMAAMSEGICLPVKETTKLHVFSSAEAIECLSPSSQSKSIRLLVAGDSYTKQLFIGLGDILMARHENIEIFNAKERRARWSQTKKALKEHRQKNSSFPDVQFVCDKDCYGKKQPFSSLCSDCIGSFTKKDKNTVAVVGAGVHLFNACGRDTNCTLNKLKRFVEANRVILASMPSYQVEKVPPKYRNASHHTGAGLLYYKTLPFVAPQKKNHPFLDVFQLTQSCFKDTCSYDGGHRSRYVNRWKAQLLLNTLCDISG
jgi:hypothetical protein